MRALSYFPESGGSTERHDRKCRSESWTGVSTSLDASPEVLCPIGSDSAPFGGGIPVQCLRYVGRSASRQNRQSPRTQRGGPRRIRPRMWTPPDYLSDEQSGEASSDTGKSRPWFGDWLVGAENGVDIRLLIEIFIDTVSPLLASQQRQRRQRK